MSELFQCPDILFIYLQSHLEEGTVVMETAGSTLTEEVLCEALSHVVSGSSEDHKKRRIEGLEAMYRRIESDSIQNRNETVRILLDMAKMQGNNDPESSLICDSLTLLINRHGEVFETILNGLRGKKIASLFVSQKWSCH
jgi:hypothetical protein